MKETKLQKAYHSFNRKYFGNELPQNISITWSKDNKKIDWLACVASWKIIQGAGVGKQESYIKINDRLRFSSQLWESALLHEMAHLAVGSRPRGRLDSHGKAFRDEMLRITKATKCRYL